LEARRSSWLTYLSSVFEKIVKNANIKIYADARGHPENTGTPMKAVHPMVRTNPVTGWKSVFAIGAYVCVSPLE
jgi:hypothetical protein